MSNVGFMINDKETTGIVDMGDVSIETALEFPIELVSKETPFRPINVRINVLSNVPVDEPNSLNFFGEVGSDVITGKITQDGDDVPFAPFPITPKEETILSYNGTLEYMVRVDLTNIDRNLYERFLNKEIYLEIDVDYLDMI